MIVTVEYCNLNHRVDKHIWKYVQIVELIESEIQPLIRIYTREASNGRYEDYPLTWFPELKLR